MKIAGYRMQARIGGMDGIFVAHHNTKEMFGFQYVPLEDMDECTSGSYEAAERTFKLGVAIMEEALQTVMEHVTVEVSAGRTCSASADGSGGHLTGQIHFDFRHCCRPISYEHFPWSSRKRSANVHLPTWLD